MKTQVKATVRDMQPGRILSIAQASSGPNYISYDQRDKHSAVKTALKGCQNKVEAHKRSLSKIQIQALKRVRAFQCRIVGIYRF
jgi:hypothetical protein